MEPVLVVDTNAHHDYGEPGDPVRIRTRFDGFAALPHAVEDFTFGPEAELHGHTWRLYICPGGDGEEYKDSLSVGLRRSMSDWTLCSASLQAILMSATVSPSTAHTRNSAE